MEPNKVNNDMNEDIFTYYYYINTYFIELYKNRNSINKEGIIKYVNATQKIFTLIVKNYVDIKDKNPKENNSLFREFVEYSNETLEEIKDQLNVIDKEMNFQNSSQSGNGWLKNIPININSSGNGFLKNIPININANNNSTNNKNNNAINNNNLNDNESEYQENNINLSESDNNNNDHMEENNAYTHNKTKRLHILKTNNNNIKELIIKKIRTTYLNVDRAFMIKPKKDSRLRDYYIIVKFVNPVLFPFKELKFCEYIDKETSNNHVINKLKKLGDLEEINL